MQSTYTVTITSAILGATPLNPADFTRPFVGIMGSQSKRDLQEYVRGARSENARAKRLEA